MRVIFLDIDGVLNSSKTANPRDLPYIVGRRLLRTFRKLAARTRAKVVLVSDWRHDPAGLFGARYWGIPYADVVPDLPRRSREDEIRAWLKKHSDVNRYAVIDDDDQLADLPAKPSRFLTQHLLKKKTQTKSCRTWQKASSIKRLKQPNNRAYNELITVASGQHEWLAEH